MPRNFDFEDNARVRRGVIAPAQIVCIASHIAADDFLHCLGDLSVKKAENE